MSFAIAACPIAIAIQPANNALPFVNFIRKSPSVVVNVPVVFACT
jgi:hypothetical protein